MTTATSRYALNKIVLVSDNVDVLNDFNVNWDAIDLKLGTQVATSSTRPSSPVQGQWEFETDTGFTRVYKGAAWSSGFTVGTSGARPANPIQGDLVYETDTTFTRSRGASAWNGTLGVATSSAMPANPIQGDLCYVSDKDVVARYTGTAWRYTGIISCTSSTRPVANIAAGTTIYETDTTRYLIYNGTSWEQKTFGVFVCTSSTHPASPFSGLEILETDTLASAIYNGSAYQYNYGPIALTTLGSAAASVTFSSIPQVYTNLRLIINARTATAGNFEDLKIQLNGVTTSNYSFTHVFTNNGSPSAGIVTAGSSSTCGYANGTNSTGASRTIIEIPNYTGTTWTKGGTWVSQTGDASTNSQGGCGGFSLSTLTAAITSIKIFTASANNLQTGSTFDLIGTP
jgi:hypothetical protein